MTDSTQSLVQRIRARIDELMTRSDQNGGNRTFELRECEAWLKDMPWHPRAAQFTAGDLELLRWLGRELSNELGTRGIISDSDIVYVALIELRLALNSPARDDELLRLKFHLAQNRV